MPVRREAPPKPSVYPYDYCQNPDCGTRKGVRYDRESRKHWCDRCWANMSKTPIVLPTPDEVEEFGAGLDLS